MPVHSDLLEILVCPETRQPVRMAPQDVLSQLNDRIRAGSLRNRGGSAVAKPLDEALLREDGRVLYPVEDSIPIMLVDESIEL